MGPIEQIFCINIYFKINNKIKYLAIFVVYCYTIHNIYCILLSSFEYQIENIYKITQSQTFQVQPLLIIALNSIEVSFSI